MLRKKKHEPEDARASLCLLCLGGIDNVRHLLDCSNLLPQVLTPEPNQAPIDAASRSSTPEFIAFGRNDAQRFLEAPSPQEAREEYAELLRKLCPHTAAHLRYDARRVAKTAYDLLAYRASAIKQVVNRGCLALCSRHDGRSLPDIRAVAPGLLSVTALTRSLEVLGLTLRRYGEHPSLTPFGAYLAAARRLRGVPPPTSMEVLHFKVSVVKLAAHSRFRAALGRSRKIFASRASGGPAPPVPTEAGRAEDASRGEELVKTWNTEQVSLTGVTLAALIYASSVAAGFGPGVEDSPPTLGYGLLGFSDWVEIGDRPSRHLAVRERLPFFLGSFVRDGTTGDVYVVTERPVAQAFPSAPPAGEAAGSATPSAVHRTVSAGVQLPRHHLLGAIRW